MKSLPTFARVAIVVAAVGLLASCMVPPYQQPYGREYTRVPNVIGMKVTQAQQSLTSYRLVAGSISYEVSSYPAGMVIGQHPYRSSRVVVGQAVNLTVSSGNQPYRSVRVPHVVGINHRDATRALAAVGLSLGSASHRYSRDYPDGTVLEQNPLPGRAVPSGSRVDVVLARSSSRTRVTVPNVVGLGRTTAIETLTRYGLKYALTHEPFSEAVRGQVISQSPRPHVRVYSGDVVTITVAGREGPGHPGSHGRLMVPNLANQSLTQARASLAERGLVLGKVTYAHGPPAGMVRSQSPAAGTTVRRGKAVDVVLGRTSTGYVRVPNLVGMIVEDAKSVVLRAGLMPGTVTRRSTRDPRIRDGQVLTQSPAPGTAVQRGAAVQIVVARRASGRMVTVPQLSGLTLRGAKARIAEQGLSLGTVTYRLSRKVGIVLVQDPVVSTRLPRGGRVNLVVGKAGTKPPPPGDVVRVPSVILKSEADARRILKRAGLKVGTILKVPGLPRQRVMAQLPLPSVRVKRGSKVSLHISH